MNMDLLKTAEALGITGDVSPLDRNWEQSRGSYSEGDVFFLKPGYILDMVQYLKLCEEIVRPIIDAAALISGSRELQRLAWHCHYLLFEADGPRPNISAWPSLSASMHELSGLFQAVLCLSGVKKARSFYETNAIPANIIIDTYLDLEIWMRDYKAKHGVWGLDKLGWLLNHLSGRLYRLGRLQFIPGEFSGRIKVFRSSKTGKLAVLSEEGVTFRADGQVDGTNGIFDEENRWTSSFTAADGIFSGNPVIPSGCASNKTVELSREEWAPVLSEGDTVLDVHIPAGGKMDHDACMESYRSAIAFFGKYFPGIPFKGFACTSWLLDHQLESLISPASNIVKFQKDFYLYPILANDFQTFERVFGEKPTDLSKAPRNTPLQAAILDYVLSGHHMRSGAGFILTSMLEDPAVHK